MANWYVRSGAGGAGTGASWANAYTTLGAALTAKSAGDTFWVADDHAETSGSNITLTSPGTAASPCFIICVNTHVTEPPTAVATSATITSTGSASVAAAGFAYCYGITFSAGTSGAANFNMTSSSSLGWVFDNCTIALGSNNSTSRINIGGQGSSLRDHSIEFIATKFSFAHASQQIVCGNAKLKWRNTSTALAGTTPTTLFTCGNGCGGRMEVSGVDLSPLASGKNLVNGAAVNAVYRFFFRNCKLGSSVSVVTGTITGPGGVEVFLDNCDSGDTNYRTEYYGYAGSAITETTIVKTSGATDGTTPISRKMVSLSTCSEFFPLILQHPLFYWSETVNSSVTLTVEIIHDSATALQDTEIWLVVESLDNGSYPISTETSDRATDIFSTGTDQTSSSVAWTTTGITNVNKQKLSVTFTPQEKGLFRGLVYLGKASYTVYINPVMDVT